MIAQKKTPQNGASEDADLDWLSQRCNFCDQVNAIHQRTLYEFDDVKPIQLESRTLGNNRHLVASSRQALIN